MDIKLDELPESTDFTKALKHAWDKAGDSLVESIKSRVSKGIGLDDTKMKAYAKSTVQQRQKQGLNTSSRNLKGSGKMLEAMEHSSVSANPGEVTSSVGFSNPEAQRRADYNQEIDPWFGTSDKDRAIFMEVLEQEMAKAMKDQI